MLNRNYRDTYVENTYHTDLIGAAQIPAAPNFLYTVSPDPFFLGLGATRLARAMLPMWYILIAFAHI